MVDPLARQHDLGVVVQLLVQREPVVRGPPFDDYFVVARARLLPVFLLLPLLARLVGPLSRSPKVHCGRPLVVIVSRVVLRPVRFVAKPELV